MFSPSGCRGAGFDVIHLPVSQHFEERIVVSGDNEVVAAKNEVPCFVE